MRRQDGGNISNPAHRNTRLLFENLIAELQVCLKSDLPAGDGAASEGDARGLHAHVTDVPEVAASKANCRFPYVVTGEAQGKAQNASDGSVRDNSLLVGMN